MQMDVRCSRASVTIILLVATVIIIFMTPLAIAVKTDTKLVYLYSDDTTSGKHYISLLADNGYQADLIPVKNMADTNLSKYNLIILGPDTEWDNITSVDLIKESNKPLIGLGEGGYELFGQLGLESGYPNGWHGNENSIYVADPSHAIFQKPNSIEVPEDRILQLYESSGHVGIYMQSTSTEMTLLGRETENEEHYPLLLEENKYLFWGFTASPESMTDIGKDLFANIIAYMSGIETSSEELKRVERPSIKDLSVVVRPELMRIETIKEPIVFATPVETIETRTGDSLDMGDGYLLIVKEVHVSGEVLVDIQQNGELIEEKTLMEDQNYLFQKASGEKLSILIEDINVGTVPNTDTQILMLVVPSLLLTVASQPAGAEIFIDDRMIDSTPSDNIILTDFNDHELRLELEGYHTYEETIQFTRGGEDEIERNIQLTSSIEEEQALKQSEEIEERIEKGDKEEVAEKEEIGNIPTAEEEKLGAEKEKTEQEPSPLPEGESKSVPGFLLTMTFASLVCGYGLMKWKKR